MVISDSEIPSDTDITNAYDNHPDVVFLTVSPAATQHVNDALINHLFSVYYPLANIPCNLSSGMINVYPAIRVLLMQNRDKNHGKLQQLPKCTMLPSCHCLMGK